MAFNAVFKALSDPTRREILRLLSGGERTAGELASSFDMTKPSMSHHFAVLKEADLIQSRRDGQQIYYSLNTTVLEDVLTRLWDHLGLKNYERERRAMTRVYWIIAFLLVAIAAGAAAWLYPSLPDQIPTHWNIRGEVDGYGGKWTLFMFPVMMAVMLVLFYFLPALSPKHFEVDTFRSTYLYIMVLVIGLFAYMQGVMLIRDHQTVAKEATVRSGPRVHRGDVSVLRLDGKRHGQGAQELLHRDPRALDPGQRSRVERHPSAGGLGVGRGRRDRIRDDRPGCCRSSPRSSCSSLSALIPVIYSFVHYKSLGAARSVVTSGSRRGRGTGHSPPIDPARDLIGAGSRRIEPKDVAGPGSARRLTWPTMRRDRR